MSSTNFIIGLVTLITTSLLVNHFDKKKVKENFAGLNVPMTWKVNREVKLSPNDMYSVSGNYQSSISPRFSNVNYGANIRYNLPSYDNMAVPNNPITYDYDDFQETSVENFQQSPQQSNDWNRVPVSESDQATFGTPTWNKMNRSGESCSQQRSSQEYTEVTDMLPVTNMETVASTMNRQNPDIQSRAAKQSRAGVQPVVYDRFVYANAKSRLRDAGDPVRGDLPVVPVLPEANKNSVVMFRPSVAPHIDLQRGYLAAAGGFDNDTNNQLRGLMNASVDGSLSTFGGTNLPVQRNTLRGGDGTIVVSNFA